MQMEQTLASPFFRQINPGAQSELEAQPEAAQSMYVVEEHEGVPFTPGGSAGQEALEVQLGEHP